MTPTCAATERAFAFAAATWEADGVVGSACALDPGSTSSATHATAAAVAAVVVLRRRVRTTPKLLSPVPARRTPGGPFLS
jgi:hypothetical protein